ncbi:MAG: hypothetical protein OXT65_08455 [Alphaproteobacteria bacterium]|nr:hypothetical protein [Alphaproteobacteria bacterium]
MKLGKLGLGVVFAGAALVGGASLVPIEAEYSSGARAGTIAKFSKKGFLCKTYEGQMATDNLVPVKMADGSTVMSNSFEFSLPSEDSALVKKLEDARQSGARVELEYKQVWKKGACISDTDYYIKAVNPAGGETKKPPVIAPGS